MHPATPSTLPPRYFDEIVEFLSSGPSVEALAAFRVSDALDQRLHELLDLNANDDLTPDERLELDEFSRVGHFMTMIKLKAKLKLAGKA